MHAFVDEYGPVVDSGLVGVMRAAHLLVHYNAYGTAPGELQLHLL